MCNNAGYISLILDLKKEILEKDSIDKKKAEKYIKDLDDFNKKLNEDDRLGLNGQIEILKVYLNLIIKLDKENDKIRAIDKNIKKQQKLLDKNNRKIDNHDKRILEMMGIFLSIFSVIGLGIVGILNIQDNLPTNILLIMGSFLIVITLLFALIKYNSENKCKFFIITTIGLVLIGIGISLYKPTDKNLEKTETKIENLEKRLDYEKRINELERKSK